MNNNILHADTVLYNEIFLQVEVQQLEKAATAETKS